MPNIAKVLKDEISRISRKEARAAVAPVRTTCVSLGRDLADLKRRVALLEKANKELRARAAKPVSGQPVAASTEPTETSGWGWISGKGIRSLRKRLGLSQAEFARLVGVSIQAVYLWERKPGMLKLRHAARTAVFAVRGIGAREARKRLEAMGADPTKPTKAKTAVEKAASGRSQNGKKQD